MGDLVHMMYVVKNTPGKHDLYITDRRDLHSDGFIHGLDRTVAELEPVLMFQPYVNSVQAYNGEEAVNLNLWRRKAYTDSWTVLLSKMFDVPVNGEAWMQWPGVRENKILHRSLHTARHGDWSKVDQSGGIEIGNEFFSLAVLFSIIATCSEFIGEQSLPLAIACALDAPRTAVLNHVDKFAYIGEEKIFNNFRYVL